MTPFRYDLNQISYDYTVEVMNRFKGQDLVDRVTEELWTEVCNIVQEMVTKTIPKKKKCKKAKQLSEEALQIAEERSERQRRKGKIYPIECRTAENSKRDKKAFLNEQCKETEENNRTGKTRDLFKNCPQFVVIHTVKGFSVVNEAEVDVFREFPCLICDLTAVGNLISGSSAFSKPTLYIWKFSVHVLLKPGLKDLSITLLSCEMTAIVQQFEHSLALPVFEVGMKTDLFQSCGYC